MTFYFTSLPRAAAHCAWRSGAFLLPLLAFNAEALVMPQRVTVIGKGTVAVVERPAAVPYLIAVGPVGFRFAPPPAVQAERPVFPAVPVVAPVAIAPDSGPTSVPPDPEPIPVLVAPKGEPEPPSASPILPDDSRREVRAEDVLPFFQFPNSSAPADSGVPPAFQPARPSEPTLPPSSATYKQK